MSDGHETWPERGSAWSQTRVAMLFFVFVFLVLCGAIGDVQAEERLEPKERFEAKVYKDAESMLWYSVNALPPQDLQTCPVGLPLPSVNVAIKEAKTRFSIDRTIEQLKKLSVDTYPATPSSYHGEIAGATDAFIHLDHKFDYKTVKDERYDVGCLWFKNVGVTLRLHSKVYIAEEYNKESCWYKEIFAHELKHIEADRAVMSEYADVIKNGLGLMFMYNIDYVSGMTDFSRLDVRFSEMRWSLREGLGVLFRAMMDERARRHEAIDRDNAYLEVSRKCGQPGFRDQQ